MDAWDIYQYNTWSALVCLCRLNRKIMNTPGFPVVPPPTSDTGAITWPRRLWRWLDDNPITQLTRAYTTITLPAFNQGTNTWVGYSTIVASFNFESPNNFSLRDVTSVVNPNYVLCVSYRFGGVLTRYKLWDAVGSYLPSSIPTYTNQTIYKNFRLEVWNTSQGQASESNGWTAYTSKLQGQDYRYAQDAALVIADVENTSFSTSSTQIASITQLMATGLSPDIISVAINGFTIGQSYTLNGYAPNDGSVTLNTVQGNPSNPVTGTFTATQITYYMNVTSPYVTHTMTITLIIGYTGLPEYVSYAPYALPLNFPLTSVSTTN